MTAKTVTFQTILDPSRETPKAYKVLSGGYFPKSQVSIVITGETTRHYKYAKGSEILKGQIVQITMPEWLARRD